MTRTSMGGGMAIDADGRDVQVLFHILVAIVTELAASTPEIVAGASQRLEQMSALLAAHQQQADVDIAIEVLARLSAGPAH